MKTMTCNQLGGACEQAFQAKTFDEMVQLSKAHATQMMQQQESTHLAAMQKMGALMKDPATMQAWFTRKLAEFDALPVD
ncbi:MAG: DUF1059 domain-containing protein [Gammaproteobacteria bacterium]|jgi:hypothetical protein|nr:DUF1059 domain-containing protein [Gammaproteobacteria bacterium]MCP4881532.1 DUF1059 domain-containing protein [Gammaproteobacteria bacterium]MDP6165580.1 DUF1059 domain-containing protein [Gammaproteobacteria bacterium]